jgi:hypothetical protein
MCLLWNKPRRPLRPRLPQLALLLLSLLFEALESEWQVVI